MTPESVREFQRVWRYDWEGNPLAVDGIPGPRTRWAMAIAQLDTRRQAIIERACGSVGLREIGGPNRGGAIDAWLEHCHAPLGSPWCAAFASWCLSVPGLPVTRQAGAQALGKSLWATRTPIPADLMWFPTGAWEGHCGIVIGVSADTVATVEGNRANGVRLQLRELKDVFFGDSTGERNAPDFVMPPGLPLVRVAREGTR